MEIQKKIGRYISIRMAIAMSLIMSLIGSLIGVLSAKSSKAPFIVRWLPSFGVSFVVALVIALAIGFIVPMKKVDEAIEAKTKLKGFKLHLVQAIVSDLIYTVIISIVMAFVTTALFALPNSKKGMEKQIEENIEIMEETHDLGLIKANESIQKDIDNLKLAPMALKNFARSFAIEFVFALLLIIIIQPIFAKNAVKKYVPRPN